MPEPVAEMSFEEAAEHTIIDLHPGCFVISRGQPGPLGEFENIIYVECFTIDLMMQGQAILVYETMFYEDGTGQTILLCSNHSPLYEEGTTKAFTYDKIPKVIKNLKWDPSN